MKRRLMSRCSGLALAAALSSTAAAQQDGSAGADDAGLMMEEMVVTAQKRASTLQDTPISITAISGDSLARSAIYDTEALSYSVPGLVIQRDVIGKVVIRGIGTENFSVGGDPGVAVNLDNAYVARSSVAIFDFFDVERVEVLRGPQGTLYGRNATGGVINVISRAPTDELDAYATATYGNFDFVRVEAAAGGPLTDRIRGRVAGFYANRDGFTTNVFPGAGDRGLGDLDSKDLWAVRGRLDADVTDRFTVELIGDIYRDDSNPVPYQYPDAVLPWQTPAFFEGFGIDPDTAAELAVSVNPQQTRVVSQGFEFDVPGFPELELDSTGRWDQTGVQAKLRYDLDTVALTSITTYRDIEFEWLNDGDGVDRFLVNYFQRDFSEQVTQELQIASNNGGPLEWIAGVFYLHEDADTTVGIPFPLGVDLPLIVLFEGSNTTDALAVFGQGTYSLGDHWRFTLGLRYSYEEKELDLFNNSFGAIVEQDLSEDFDAFTPKIGIDYIFDDGTLLYASVTRGFKSGGFNLIAVQDSFDQEIVWAYEAGVKTSFLDDRIQVNLGAFYYDYKDQQIGQVTNLAAILTNAADSTLFGGELEVRALLAEGLLVDLGVAYLNTEFDEFCTLDTRDPTLPRDVENCPDPEAPGDPDAALNNLAGNDLPRSPEWTVNAAVQYERPVGQWGTLMMRGEWQFTDRQFFTQFNRPNVSQDAFSLFNARLEFESANGRWTIAGWGRNLANKDYLSNVLESGVVNTAVVPQVFFGAPRTYGITVGFRY